MQRIQSEQLAAQPQFLDQFACRSDLAAFVFTAQCDLTGPLGAKAGVIHAQQHRRQPSVAGRTAPPQRRMLTQPLPFRLDEARRRTIRIRSRRYN